MKASDIAAVARLEYPPSLATAAQIDVRSSAMAVMLVLTDVQAYLTTAVNPDRVALADLEMEPMGWTKRVYSQKAFEIWQAQLRLFPDDPLILHHMAIMHHARAFDLEVGPKPAESDADWVAAMGYWHRLHGMDSFWENLTKKVCAGTLRQDAVRKLRADFPQMILAIHYDIALDKETREKRKTRTKFHIAMVQKAPFDAQHRAAAQRAAYYRYVMAVPDEVWQLNELREEVIAEGQNAIAEYLMFDPNCAPALEDVLRLQRRIQRSRTVQKSALDPGDPRWQAILTLEKMDAAAWRPFFDQLVSVPTELDYDVRQELTCWYRAMAHVQRACDCETDAIPFYKAGIAAGITGSEAHQLCVRELGETMAYLARERVRARDPCAQECCDVLRIQPDISVYGLFLLANAYMLLGQMDVTEELCERGMTMEPPIADPDEFERFEEKQQQFTGVLEQVHATRNMVR